MSRDRSSERVTADATGDGDGQVRRVMGAAPDETDGPVARIACSRHRPAGSGDDPGTLPAWVPPGEDIPGDLYLALAEVLAFVYGVSDERPPPES